jgi:hypothetical protein
MHCCNEKITPMITNLGLRVKINVLIKNSDKMQQLDIKYVINDNLKEINSNERCNNNIIFRNDCFDINIIRELML